MLSVWYIYIALFIAKVSLPHEQSVAGALFQTMTQVRLLTALLPFSKYPQTPHTIPPTQPSFQHLLTIPLRTQLGTALGLAVTTIVYDRVLATQSSLLGVTIDTSGTNAPKPAQLKAYQAAEWTAFGFGILGTFDRLC